MKRNSIYEGISSDLEDPEDINNLKSIVEKYSPNVFKQTYTSIQVGMDSTKKLDEKFNPNPKQNLENPQIPSSSSTRDILENQKLPKPPTDTGTPNLDLPKLSINSDIINVDSSQSSFFRQDQTKSSGKFTWTGGHQHSMGQLEEFHPFVQIGAGNAGFLNSQVSAEESK